MEFGICAAGVRNIFEISGTEYLRDKRSQTDHRKKLFLQTLIKIVENIRMYLGGQEEAVITKDLLLLMNSRYIYLPELYSNLYDEKEVGLVEQEKQSGVFSPEILKRYLNQAARGTSFEKGMRFEEVDAYFMKAAKDMQIAGRRVKTEIQEIDLCLVNTSFVRTYGIWGVLSGGMQKLEESGGSLSSTGTGADIADERK